jgi:hypothetical protein
MADSDGLLLLLLLLRLVARFLLFIEEVGVHAEVKPRTSRGDIWKATSSWKVES